ncbi:MAG: hypothetical protein ABI907_02360 [Ramlibacter sp.]
MSDALIKLLAGLGASGWDFRIASFDGDSLTLAAGTSRDHARPLVVFSGVSYLDCPTVFSLAAFSVASDSERDSVRKLVPLDPEDVVIQIEAETQAGLGTRHFRIVATAAHRVTAP